MYYGVLDHHSDQMSAIDLAFHRHRRGTIDPAVWRVEASSELQKLKRGSAILQNRFSHAHLSSGLQKFSRRCPADWTFCGVEVAYCHLIGQSRGLKENVRGAACKYQQVPVAPPELGGTKALEPRGSYPVLISLPLRAFPNLFLFITQTTSTNTKQLSTTLLHTTFNTSRTSLFFDTHFLYS
jgi:hypothetical protein